MPATALSSFVEHNLKAIYEATSQKAFDAAFEAFFAKELDVCANGESITRAHYKQQLWREKHTARSGALTFHGLLAVPADNAHPAGAGTVGVFLTAIISFMMPHGRPTQERVTASYRLIIEPDESVEPIHHGERPGDLEIRRVSSVDVVVSEKEASEVHL